MLKKTFYIDAELIDGLKNLTKKTRLKVSQMVRVAIQEYLDNHHNK